MTYEQKLKDSRWLVKRESLLQKRGEQCQLCKSSDQLTIHHGYYRPKGDPWDYEDESLWVLCWPCHESSQKTLTEIHRIIGHIHPNGYEDVKQRVGDSTHEFRFGITKDEMDEMLRDDMDADSDLYSDYDVSIISSSDLGPSLADELESEVYKRFPGIGVGISVVSGERDAIASVSGPDREVSKRIQAWCNSWSY